jgi:6,7-dimethyl-8-ribityllumazine synthase
VLIYGQQGCLVKRLVEGIGLPGRSRVPSLSTDKVATTSPVDAVATTGTVGVGDTGATISPPRVD